MPFSLQFQEVCVNLDECVTMKSQEKKTVPYGERCSLCCKLDLISLINSTIGIDLQLTKHIRIRNKNQQKKSITYLQSISIDETNHMLFE